MKPVQASIPSAMLSGRIFSIRKIDQPHFASEFHFHKECQLAYITKGAGKRIIGDAIDNFEEGELVFIGPDLPHVWYNTNSKNNTGNSQSVSLYITRDLLIEHLTAFGDIQRIELLFQKAQRGMLISGKSRSVVISLLKRSLAQDGIKHIITLLKIVHILSITQEYTLLASNNYVNYFQFRDSERMNRVYGFVLANFRNELSLKQVAAIARMNPQAFCRFFKSRTQKSFTQFVNELRIGHACKLLSEKNGSVASIAHSCGFNNVSNFNRFFRAVKNISPRLYRKKLELH